MSADATIEPWTTFNTDHPLKIMKNKLFTIIVAASRQSAIFLKAKVGGSLPGRHYVAFLALTMLSTFNHQLSTCFAQGTAFTYQGRLNLNGSPANGNYDFQFVLFNTNQFGFPAAPILTNAAVPVNNGLFTTTLDFGGGIFTGTNFWLDISVRTNGNGAFNTLAPRQPVTPAPYAITAANLAGVVENNSIQNGVSLATISGGGGNLIQSNANHATISGGGNNTIQSDAVESTIGGGFGDRIYAGAFDSTISGGNENSIRAGDSVVGGGQANVINTNSLWSTIGGGLGNLIDANATGATLGGGRQNGVSGTYGTVPGGYGNFAQGRYSFAAGQQAQALHQGAFVWADSQNAPFSSTGNDQFLIRAAGGVSINMNNPHFGASFYVQGSRDGGNFGTAVATIENTSTTGNEGGSGPARVVLDGGSGLAGALSISDKNAKKNFQLVDGEAVLKKTRRHSGGANGITNGNRTPDTPHIGPMAQDFKGAFYPGRDDKSISTLEFDGVELAAIQGLNRKLTTEGNGDNGVEATH